MSGTFNTQFILYCILYNYALFFLFVLDTFNILKAVEIYTLQINVTDVWILFLWTVKWPVILDIILLNYKMNCNIKYYSFEL